MAEEPFVRVSLDNFYERMLKIGDDVSEIKSSLHNMDSKLADTINDIKDHEERLRKVEGQRSTIVSFLALVVAVIGPVTVFFLTKG